MITVKSTASFTMLRREMWSILSIVEEVYASKGLTAEISCGTNGHPESPEHHDPHPHGFALDFSCHDVPLPYLKGMHQELVERLGPTYTVLYNDQNLDNAVYEYGPQPHFHVQTKKEIWHKIMGLP